MNRRLPRALSVALICALPAVAVAAEIHDAVRGGDTATVTRLLKKNPKLVNLTDEESGTTPLYHAVDTGNLAMVEILLKAGAKVNAKTVGGMTPMLRAAAIVNPEVSAGFLSKGLPPYFSTYGPAARTVARTASREALKTWLKSLVLDPEEEAARLAILRLLVERGASMSDIMPNTKCTPLHFAVLIPNIKALEYLLEQGADPDASAQQGLRPLHLAVLWENAEMVKVLIAHMADVNAAQVPLGIRPLHLAVSSGDMAIIRLLLDHGAKVNAVNKNGSPALHGATWSDEIFNLLLERGADPKLEASDGTTTLHRACQDGSKTLVEKLLQLHPDLEAWDGQEFTPLLNAAEAGRVDLLKLLVGAGAYLMATEKNGWNALHLAAAYASPEAVHFLLDQKMDVNARSDFGETALMNAAEQGRLETVVLLLRAGANVNVETTRGGTPLMAAAFGTRKPPDAMPPDSAPVRDPALAPDYLKIAELLLTGGADVQARNREGKTALHYAATSGNVEVFELLLAKGAEVDAKDTVHGRTPLNGAAYNADVKTVAALLDKGADITARDAYGLQAIHAAAKRNDPAVLTYLLEKGADITAAESHGGTPLHCAAIESKPEAARVLLEHGAPPASLDKYQKSPLHFAALLGSVEIVRLLLDHRVPVNGADYLGDTPLHGAAMVRVGQNDLQAAPEQPAATVNSSMAYINKSQPADKLKIVKLLLAKGAKPNVKNLEGATPIDVAEKFGTPGILAALKSQASPSRGK